MVAMFPPMGLLDILILAAIVVIVVAVFRKRARRHACGRAWWPALLLAPLLAIFFFATMRVSTMQHHRARAEERRAAAEAQAAVARSLAVIRADAEHQIATMNIHQLMDKADAPRIALPPDAPAAPEAPARVDSAASTDDGDEGATPSDEKIDAKGESADAERTEAKGDKADDGDAKLAEEHAEEKTADSDEAVAPAAAAVSDADEAQPKANAGRPDEPVASARPDWVDDPPRRVGNVRREVLVVGEYSTADECYRAADFELLRVADQYFQRLVGYPWLSHAESIQHRDGRTYAIYDPAHPLPDGNMLVQMRIGVEYLRRELVKDEFFETVERSVGPMKRLYVLVEFSPALDNELKSRWDAHRRQERLAAVGKGAGSVLALLALAWGLLRVDTATKGYYTKRLFLGAVAVIIGFLTAVAYIG